MRSLPHGPTMKHASIAYNYLFTLLFLNFTSSVVKINDALLRKIEIQLLLFFFLLWRSIIYQLEPTVRTAYGFLETFSDVIDGALTAHTF